MKARKWICAMLALALFLGCAGLTPVQAADHEVADIDQVPSQTVDLETPPSAEISQEAELVQLCEDSGIFRYVDEDTFRQANHVARLTEEETLNTYVFQNRDGTKSVYYMEEDVKYLAADGSIRDKDITLVRAGAGYDVRDNNVSLGIPDSAASGIRVSHAQNSVRLIPLDGSGNATLEDNSILYADFYGAGIDLKYTPTLSGIKEDIILSAYNGISSFDFQLETGGLYLYENGGQYYLAEQDSEEIAFYLGQIIVYDAIGRPSAGSMTVETVDPGQKYRLTISASVDFLTDPTTVYPVTIDPTITVTDTMAGGVIEDAPVFSGYPDWNFGNYVYNSIGYIDTAHGVGRVAVKLNGLLNNAQFKAIGEDYIDKVEFCIMDNGSNYTTINLHALTENSAWTESTVTWNNVGAHGSVVDSVTVGGNKWASFDITTLAKQWKSGEQNGQCGFILISSEETTLRTTTRSCEYGSGDYWPYVIVTHSLELSLNCYYKEIQLGGNWGLVAYNESGETLADVSWISNNPYVAEVSANGIITGVGPGEAQITAVDADGNSMSCVVDVRLPNGIYFIQNVHSGYLLDSGTERMDQVQQTPFDADIDQYWEIEHVGDGIYTIRACRFSFALYLCANLDNLFADYSVGLSLTQSIERSKWLILTSDSGAVCLSPLSDSESDYVLAVNASDGSVIRAPYINDNDYSDEWILLHHKDYTWVHLPHNTYDTTMDKTIRQIKIAWSDYDGYTSSSMTTAEMLQHLASSDVFVCITHGTTSTLQTADGYLSIDMINALEDGALADVELVVLGACEAGAYSHTGNIAEALYEKGVQTVIAFKVDVSVFELLEWIMLFAQELGRESTISQALDYADEEMEEYIYGNDTTKASRRYILGPIDVLPFNE